MQPPTSEQIRALTKLPLDALGYGSDDPDPLDPIVNAIWPWVEDRAGWYFEPLPSASDAGSPQISIQGIPVRREAQMLQAVQMAVEFDLVSRASDQIESIADIETIQSFSTDGYSETRVGASRSYAATASVQARQLHPWPRLNALLRDLQNPDLAGIGHDVPAVGSEATGAGVNWNVGWYIMNARNCGAYDPFDMRGGGGAGYYVGLNGLLGWG